MSAIIKQTVTVQHGGVIEVRSPDLHVGEQAEVTVVVRNSPQQNVNDKQAGGWRRFAGVLNGNDPHAADNDRIDADLARGIR